MMRGQKSTEAYKKEMWAGQSKFLVVVRVRPINEQERRTSKDVTRVLDEKVVIIRDPASDSKDILRQNRAQDRRYAFDHSFGPTATQEYVYNHTTRFVVEGVLNGFNATVFAYGATGAGKTFTMLGNMDQPGLMVLTLTDLFRKIEEWTRTRRLQFKVMLTYIEVYNELIRDLLTPDSDVLDLREDPIKGPTVAGVTELVCTSTGDVMTLLRRGNKQRTQEPTAANKESSRSHAVLQISVEQTELNGESKKVGKLSMVDLAGSERAAKTTNSGIRLKEGANINRSLLALGNCINALTSGGKGSYVPYRDSKLTRMLKDSLGGNCRTVMIANVSPAASCFDETLNTLKYANRAKKIKTNVSRNVLNVNYHISEYENLISGLRNEISVLKNQLARHGGPSTSLASPMPSRRGERESMAMNSLRNDLVDNFKERMQLRRSLIDLQAQNIQNNIEIQRRQAVISAFEERMAEAASLNLDPSVEVKMAPKEEAELEQARAEVRDYMHASATNNELGQQLQERLRKNEDQATSIRDKLHTRITSDERKELLNLEYRIGLLELDNMELEHSRLLHEQVVKQRDMRVQHLLRQVQQRDKIIEQLRNALEDAGLGDLVDADALGALAMPEELNDMPLIDFVPQRHDAQRPFSPSAKVSKMPHAAAVQADDLVLQAVNEDGGAVGSQRGGSPNHSPINMSPRAKPPPRKSIRESASSPIFSPANAWVAGDDDGNGDGTTVSPLTSARRGGGRPHAGAGMGAGAGSSPSARSLRGGEHTVSLPALQPGMPQVENTYDLPAKNPYYPQRQRRPSYQREHGGGGGGGGGAGRNVGGGGGPPGPGAHRSRSFHTRNGYARIRGRNGGSNEAPVNTVRSQGERSNGGGGGSGKYDTSHSEPNTGRRRRPRARPHMPRQRPTRMYRNRKGGGRTNAAYKQARGSDADDAGSQSNSRSNGGRRRRRGRNSIGGSPYSVAPKFRAPRAERRKVPPDRLRRGNSNADPDPSPDRGPSSAAMLRGINARMARIHPQGVPQSNNDGSSGSEEERVGLSVVGRNARGREQRNGRGGGGGRRARNGGDVQVHADAALLLSDGPEADGLDDYGMFDGSGPEASPSEPEWRAKFNGGSGAEASKLPFLSSPTYTRDY